MNIYNHFASGVGGEKIRASDSGVEVKKKTNTGVGVNNYKAVVGFEKLLRPKSESGIVIE